MRVRGERECRACGTRWSYYETGDVACPDCGSPVSVGVDERAEHTDNPQDLDLTQVRRRVDADPLSTVAEAAAERARTYRTERGFVSGGDLRPLTDTFLAAAELAALGSELARGLRTDDDAEAYFFDLLAGADDGDRPGPSAVPHSLRAARGRAYASAIADYEGAVRRAVEDVDAPARSVLDAVRTRRKRVEALQGDVDPADVEGLVRTVRDLSTYLRDGDEGALARAQSRLERTDVSE